MPVAASAIYFLNLRGDVLINRTYRDDVGGDMVDAFRTHIMQTKELGNCPVRQIGGCSFVYMRISNVYIVIAVALFKSYFGGAFDEDAIRNNFVLIYELLDEIMDFGYPQNLSPEILKLYITQEGVRSPFSSKRKRIISKWLTLNSKLDVCILRTKEAPNSNRSSCTRMREEPEEEENVKVLKV
ncbi:hypothetical protein F2Q69_00034450 [Brassica cretica]|uniref:AP complex mu/sigma subunit domain-containing protein n=1 Tax=Brassica cretica TaxID=69181 RepID=A0A8S9SQ22_BRACR|nr:hypothetical protein F2Q69_00034450 [Brassica cretica]